jgi:ElaB/YqjD/DUF883 family membrane-anchored ribosome-binding protein
MNAFAPENASRSARGEPSKAAVEPPPAPETSEPGSVGETMSQLGRDVASLKSTLSQLVSRVGDQGTKAVQGMSQSVASQVGSAASGMADTGSDLVSAAQGHAKTLASELEDMARRNPLGTIAGAVLVGAIIGMMSRGGRG